MVPRRQNYTRSRSTSYSTPSYVPIPPAPPNRDLMPPSSRYLHNLRVIQRHDPTITSLFDQFPHVCVYHHKGDEWQKKGCEGAMFLFEREQEPKYGFYILNRNNTGDYIQRMTPDDDVEFASAYLIYRAYGKVTSDTIGLWTMVTQDREAMSQVMMRLHSYIKRNLRYPDDYRRGPDTWSTTPGPIQAKAVPTPPTTASLQDFSSGSTSALSVLLAKLGSHSEPPPDPSPPNRTVSASVPPPATGIPLLDSIFASASTPSVASSSNPVSQMSHVSFSGGGGLHSLFVNGKTAVKDPSSASTSCGPTPTQHLSRLPDSPSRSNSNAKLIGGLVSSGSSISPLPIIIHHGKGSIPRAVKQPNGRNASYGNTNGGQKSDHHSVPREPSSQDDESWEEDTGASASAGAVEGGIDPLLSPRTNKTRKARKRERERERKRRLKRRAMQSSSSGDAEAHVEEPAEWPLVDDRSLSVGEEGDQRGSLGLGDGLLDALAAVSEPEMMNGQAYGSVLQHSTASKKGRKERGKDRWKRKQKDGVGSSLASGNPANHQPTLKLEESRNALLDAYGFRRRVGDAVLGEEALGKELVALIQNNRAFVRELHQQYLKRVQV